MRSSSCTIANVNMANRVTAAEALLLLESDDSNYGESESNSGESEDSSDDGNESSSDSGKRMPEEDEVEGLPEVEVQPVLEGEEGVGHTAEVARHSPIYNWQQVDEGNSCRIKTLVSRIQNQLASNLPYMQQVTHRHQVTRTQRRPVPVFHPPARPPSSACHSSSRMLCGST